MSSARTACDLLLCSTTSWSFSLIVHLYSTTQVTEIMSSNPYFLGLNLIVIIYWWWLWWGVVDCQKYLFLQSQAKNQVLCTHVLCVRVWQLNLSVSKPFSDKKAVTLHIHVCSWQRLWSELGHLCELVQSSTLRFSFIFMFSFIVMFSFCLWSSFTNSWNSSDLFPHRKTALRQKIDGSLDYQDYQDYQNYQDFQDFQN